MRRREALVVVRNGQISRVPVRVLAGASVALMVTMGGGSVSLAAPAPSPSPSTSAPEADGGGGKGVGPFAQPEPVKPADPVPGAPAQVKAAADEDEYVSPGRVRTDAPGVRPGPGKVWRFAGVTPAATTPSETSSTSSTSRVASSASSTASDDGVAAPGLGVQKFSGIEEFGVRDQLSLGVNLGNGNLVLRDTDLKINAPGVATRSDRFYNGLSSRVGAFGKGWSLAGGADVGLEITASKVIFRGPSGFRGVSDGLCKRWVELSEGA